MRAYNSSSRSESWRENSATISLAADEAARTISPANGLPESKAGVWTSTSCGGSVHGVSTSSGVRSAASTISAAGISSHAASSERA